MPVYPIKKVANQTDYHNFHDPSYKATFGYEHNADDISSPVGTPVYATVDGIVHYSNSDWAGSHFIILEGSDGTTQGYAHLSERSVWNGKQVNAGEQIGLSGAEGHVTGAHLHFSVTRSAYNSGGRGIIEADTGEVNPSEYLTGSTPPPVGGETHHQTQWKNPTGLINIKPTMFIFMNKNTEVYEYKIASSQVLVDKANRSVSVDVGHVSDRTFTFDKIAICGGDSYNPVIIEYLNKSGTIKSKTYINITLTMKLEKLSQKFSLLTPNFLDSYFDNINNQSALNRLALKDNGWKWDGSQLVGKVYENSQKTKFKHNEEMFTSESYEADAEYKYTPSLYKEQN